MLTAATGAPPSQVQASQSRRIVRIYAFLLFFNAAAWLWALVAFRQHPLLLWTGLLAYTLGLRHAVDADHIAAIDNITRKLMQAGQRPMTVGLWFSLGHSSVVVLASVAIAMTATALQEPLAPLKNAGAIIGTLVSTGFLLVIAVVNLVILCAVVRKFARLRRGEPYVEQDLDKLLAGRGLLARLLRPLFRLITRSWHMYPLGFLFGLGFDTATEIGLLGIAATSATQGLPVWSMLVFPALFTAGMSLVDTTDGIFMLRAYGWAFGNPARKLYYNIVMTSVSVAVAVIVGSIEALGLFADRLHLQGRFWDAIGALGDQVGTIGYVIVMAFALCWIASAALYRWRRTHSDADGVGSPAVVAAR
ncbi:MAG: HoxN/HupN/NixA family nickel/cobalt transporter [Burkholderiaceae bacterium]|jgi:high-affinity nickel-transport protein|nr:HoxN/HupN/NixA family nickel/cobalt transporter [Burkholderiaceae bacterium]